MESIHGVDVSWLHNTNSRESTRSTRSERSSSITSDIAGRSSLVPKTNGTTTATSAPRDTPPSTPRQIPQRAGPPTRTIPTTDKVGSPASLPGKSTLPGPTGIRRNSWLSSISSKFSSSPSSAQPAAAAAANGEQTPRSPAAPLSSTPEEEEPRPPVQTAPRNAVLPHGQKAGDGTAPYTPVPPKSTHPNFLTSALRRLSSGGQLASSASPRGNGGICERRVLNVDVARERCCMPELDQAKLRRVAFCVDVEIASRPRYNDEEPLEKAGDKTKKKKLGEKGEGEALKHATEVKDQKEKDGVVHVSGEQVEKETAKEGSEPATNGTAQTSTEKPMTRKKEKKKKSDEERKARKEKKRKLAEESGTIPVELVRGDSDSSASNASAAAPLPRSSSSPTTDPVRIYRRCCQLRETPILKKITEQLAQPSNTGDKPGVVTRLDLTDCWLQLADLATLGDYLAVVPVKELIMENCGLTDEGVRIILAGLLAVSSPDQEKPRRSPLGYHQGATAIVPRHGAVQRVTFKNNPKVGRDGWRHISLFINMSRSLRNLDVSLIPFPQAVSPKSTESASPASNASPATGGAPVTPAKATIPAVATGTDPAAILSKALGTRLAGAELELLNMAETGLTAPQIGLVVDGAIQCGLRRLGLAGNNLDAEGMAHVARYLEAGKCEGLDLGGNQLSDLLDPLAESIFPSHPLFALSLANCGLTSDSLLHLLPALVRLTNFRFIDLSHNAALFATKPSAVHLLRKYLPLLQSLKRIHLSSCAMSPEQAIALAEIFPDSPGLAHVNLLGNPELTALATAGADGHQEEACALYASLMAAVRVSRSLICIDIDLPAAASSEVVKALAKQVVAYSLRNMERGPVAEITQDPSAPPPAVEPRHDVAVPDVLAHLVGYHYASSADDADSDADAAFQGADGEGAGAPDEDYVIGGTGVVKALGICLKNRSGDSRRPSIDKDRVRSSVDLRKGDDGAATSANGAGRARDMSKNLLGSARRIRARLQPALLKEAKEGGGLNYHKLVFLDQTLSRMITRFENEYPDTRLPPSPPLTNPALPSAFYTPSNPTASTKPPVASATDYAYPDETALSDDDIDAAPGGERRTSRPILSRHNSDVSLASKALSQEEGRMLRFGAKFGGEGDVDEDEGGMGGVEGGELVAAVEAEAER
ncbi:Microtubules assembly and stabilization protein [Pseudogymnoascus australis]